MNRAVQMVWWIGLVGALVATLVILKEVALVLRALRDIHQLGEITREAARGIARNLEPIAGLGALGGPAGQVREGVTSVGAVVASLEQKTAVLNPAAKTRGG